MALEIQEMFYGTSSSSISDTRDSSDISESSQGNDLWPRGMFFSCLLPLSPFVPYITLAGGPNINSDSRPSTPPPPNPALHYIQVQPSITSKSSPSTTSKPSPSSLNHLQAPTLTHHGQVPGNLLCLSALPPPPGHHTGRNPTAIKCTDTNFNCK